MNTPDTELEDNIKSALSSNPALRDKILALIPSKKGVVTPDTEGTLKKSGDEAEILVWYVQHAQTTQDAVDHVGHLLTSRDTYWKERVRKEVEEVKKQIIQEISFHEPSMSAKKPKGYNEGLRSGWYACREFVRLIKVIPTPITNEDNLK